jgi:hypothetical protein
MRWWTLPIPHHLLLALLFWVGLELVVAFQAWIILLLCVLLGLTIYGIVLLRVEEGGDFRSVQILLPALAAAGLIGFTVFLPRGVLLHGYMFMASVVVYWLLKHGAKQAYPTWNWTLSTIIYFLDVAVILGLRFNFFLPVLYILAAVLVVSFLITFQAWRRLAPERALLLALAVSLVLTELVWVLLFLPLHFFAQSGIVVVLYYALFHIVSVGLTRPLRRGDTLEYAVLGSIAVFILLAATNWT